MLTHDIQKILLRDLDKLAQEIKLYPDELSLWQVKGNIANSAGNLCLHLCGNLRFYIGHTLGTIAYERNRDAEFSLKNVPRQQLFNQIESAKACIEATLPRLSGSQLDQEYPIIVFKEPMSTGFFLIHLAAHFSYHLGQINYHRRLTS